MFVNPRQVRENNYSFYLYRDTNKDVTIENNIAYGYLGSALKIEESGQWENVQLNDNYFVAKEDAEGYLVEYRGNDIANSGVSYSGNNYFTDFDSSEWFNLIGSGDRMSLDQWRSISGEADASIADFTPSDPGRNVDSYAEVLGVGSTIGDFAEEARKQSRFNYREKSMKPRLSMRIFGRVTSLKLILCEHWLILMLTVQSVLLMFI